MILIILEIGSFAENTVRLRHPALTRRNLLSRPKGPKNPQTPHSIRTIFQGNLQSNSQKSPQ
jgi:hypothetical protein